MAEISVTNIDETLRALRSERVESERKSKIRDEEYKRATKLYIKALQKETEAFERNRPNYDKRNDSFKEEVQGIMERFKVGAFGLLKSRDRLHKEIDGLNSYLLEHYPKLATQVKDSLEKEKEELETRLKKIREQNEKNTGPDFQLQVPSVNIVDVREKRYELDRELRSLNPPNFTYLKDLQNNQSYVDKYIPVINPSARHKSPSDNRSYLEDFIAKPNPVETFENPSLRIEPKNMTPSYVIEKEGEIVNIPRNQPRTDFLSEFMYRVPKAVYSPSKTDQRKPSPAKSESLLYSPFTAGGDNDSRFSRMSSAKKS